MRTIFEIEKEALELVEPQPGLEDAADRIRADMAIRIASKGGMRWLARMYDGHMGLICKLSGISPFPKDESALLLDTLQDIADLIRLVGWPLAHDYVEVARSMKYHFDHAMALRDEKTAVLAANSVPEQSDARH